MQLLELSVLGGMRNVVSSKKFFIFPLRHDVDLQQTSHCVHPVEDAKGQADVHNGCPHGIAVEAELCRVIKLRTGSKGWHDPENDIAEEQE